MQKYVVPDDAIFSSNPKKIDSENPDDAVRRLEGNSDENYQKIAGRIVEISDEYLTNQTKKKKELQTLFSRFFTTILIIQFAVMVLIICLDSFALIPFEISEKLIITYIVSVFAETLGAISVMLAFAFSSKEESEIVKVLNAVIQNYQKYKKDN